jgi:hypothetical protein
MVGNLSKGRKLLNTNPGSLRGGVSQQAGNLLQVKKELLIILKDASCLRPERAKKLHPCR